VILKEKMYQEILNPEMIEGEVIRRETEKRTGREEMIN